MTAEDTIFTARRKFQLLRDRAVAAQRAGREDEAAAIRTEMRRYRDWLAAMADVGRRGANALNTFESAWKAVSEADDPESETVAEAVERYPALRPLLDAWLEIEAERSRIESENPWPSHDQAAD